MLFSINTSNDHYIDFEDIISDNLISFTEICNRCKRYYDYKILSSSEFLFIIFDYDYDILIDNIHLNIKKNFLKLI